MFSYSKVHPVQYGMAPCTIPEAHLSGFDHHVERKKSVLIVLYGYAFFMEMCSCCPLMVPVYPVMTVDLKVNRREVKPVGGRNRNPQIISNLTSWLKGYVMID
jgi:hypothetical protein